MDTRAIVAAAVVIFTVLVGMWICCCSKKTGSINIRSRSPGASESTATVSPTKQQQAGNKAHAAYPYAPTAAPTDSDGKAVTTIEVMQVAQALPVEALPDALEAAVRAKAGERGAP